MLIPREHGAYGQLAFPLIAALAIGRPVLSAYALAIAAAGAFLAHESLLVVIGQRGRRAAREQSAEAWRSLAVLGSVALVTGVAALWWLPHRVLPYLALPVLLGGAVFAAVFAHRERTTAGEMLVGAALASSSLPVALAGGVELPSALTIVAVFVAIFTTATIAVRAVIGRVSKAGGPSQVAGASWAVAAIGVLSALANAHLLARVAPWAALPVALVGLALVTRPPSPKQLRLVGWTLVASTALVTIVLVAALR